MHSNSKNLKQPVYRQEKTHYNNPPIQNPRENQSKYISNYNQNKRPRRSHSPHISLLNSKSPNIDKKKRKTSRLTNNVNHEEKQHFIFNNPPVKKNINFAKGNTGFDSNKPVADKRTNFPLLKQNSKNKNYSVQRPGNIKGTQSSSNNKNNGEIKSTARRVYLRKDQNRKRNPSINNITKHEEKTVTNYNNKRSKSESHKINRVKPEKKIERGEKMVKFIKDNEGTLPPFDRATVSLKPYGIIDSFAVNTHKGYVRANNEDRVSILLNAQKQFKLIDNDTTKLNCCMFSVFDGHGGSYCSNFLKNNLHATFIEKLDIEGQVVSSLRDIYKRLDDSFIKESIVNREISGSTANTIIVHNNTIMVVNSGDSRSIFSMRRGSKVIEGSDDHKPEKISEFNRILKCGGDLYRMSYNTKTGQNQFYFVNNYNQVIAINEVEKNVGHLIFGPWRIKPGGLSVSRGFGDIESKASAFGGKFGVVTSDPDIFEYDVKDMDFCILGCWLISRWDI